MIYLIGNDVFNKKLLIITIKIPIKIYPLNLNVDVYTNI